MSFQGHQDPAQLRSLRCRPPRRPACSAPAQVSSTSISPRSRSRNRFHHRPAISVEHHPRRLVAGQAKFPLQRRGGDSAFVGSHQTRRPEPGREWHLRPMKNSPGCQRNLVQGYRALGALATPLVHQSTGTPITAAGTGEPIWSATRSQVAPARLFAGESD
jgi:hypothetical protein